jgi:hypothetical protein
MIKIFVSGPYTNGDVGRNVKSAMDATNELIERGYAPYCPHLTHFLHINNWQPYEKWLALDIQYLDICDALLRIPGESFGADKEVDFAVKKGIPVFFNIDQVDDFYRIRLTPEI